MTQPINSGEHPLISHKRVLTKDHFFMKAIRNYLMKSELQPPRKLMLEIIGINLGLVEALSSLIELEARRAGISNDAFVFELEALHDAAQKRLQNILRE